jgi:cobalt/nickel transport system permease protein
MIDLFRLRLALEPAGHRIAWLAVEVRLFVALGLVGLIASTPLEAGPWPLVRLAGLLLGLILLVGAPFQQLAARLLPLIPIGLVFLLAPVLAVPQQSPEISMAWGGTSVGWVVALAGFLRLLLVGLTMALFATITTFDQQLLALRRLKLPEGLVLTLGFMFRYLYLLVEEAARMRIAHDARGGGLRAAARRRHSIGGLVGSLFVRTYARGERIHQAMLARGFAAAARPSGTVVSWPSWMAGIGVVALACTLRWGGGLG